jgi:hypothetical protein
MILWMPATCSTLCADRAPQLVFLPRVVSAWPLCRGHLQVHRRLTAPHCPAAQRAALSCVVPCRPLAPRCAVQVTCSVADPFLSPPLKPSCPAWMPCPFSLQGPLRLTLNRARGASLAGSSCRAAMCTRAPKPDPELHLGLTMPRCVHLCHLSYDLCPPGRQAHPHRAASDSHRRILDAAS